MLGEKLHRVARDVPELRLEILKRVEREVRRRECDVMEERLIGMLLRMVFQAFDGMIGDGDRPFDLQTDDVPDPTIPDDPSNNARYDFIVLLLLE